MMWTIYFDAEPHRVRATLRLDDPAGTTFTSTGAQHVEFHLTDPAQPGHGATLRVEADGYRPIERRVELPAFGGLPPVVLEPLGHGRLRVSGDQFLDAAGDRWVWAGCTEMRLPARLSYGEGIAEILDQRQAAGARLLRSLAQVSWAEWGPHFRPDYWGDVRRYLDALGARGLYCEWVVFADTRLIMPDQGEQLAFWDQTLAVARDYPLVVIELLNEDGHPTQAIDPRRFSRPSGLLASHGSGLTDVQPVAPLWDFATYHARRTPPPPSAKPFNNYNPYEFHPEWPHPVPYIPDEGVKPEDYAFDPRYAAQLGHNAAGGAGGTFHSNAGVQSILFSPGELACAQAFYTALGSRVDT